MCIRDRPHAPFRHVPGCLRRPLPAGDRPRAARHLSPALDHERQPASSPRGHLPRRRPAHPLDRRGLPGERLERARDLGLLRHRVRRSPGADPNVHAGRLARSPAAQGLSPRRHPRGVQGRYRAAAGRAQEVQLMTEQTRDIHATPVAGEKDTEGASVYNPAGGDWDAIVDEASSLHEERIVVNMGPQHPSSHGVLRLIIELDGESVTEAKAGVGYLHTGIEKSMEFRTWTQGVTFCTRMDYLTPLFNETAYCLAVEKLLGITDQVPERASIIRVLLMELNRVGSHLVCLATGGQAHEVGSDPVELHQEHPDDAGALGNLVGDAEQLLDGQAVGRLVEQRREVVHAGAERHALGPGAELHALLDTGVQVPDARLGLGDGLAVELDDHAQDAVRGRVLRTHVDDDPLLVQGGRLVDDGVPVATSGVVDAGALGVLFTSHGCGMDVAGLFSHQLYFLRSSGGGTVAPLYSTGMPPRG